MVILNYFRHPDRVFALVLIAVAALMFVMISGMEEPYSPGAMAASTYPRLILGCIMALSFFLILKPRQSIHEQGLISLRALSVIVLVAIYIALIEVIGFFLLTPLLLFALPLLAGYRRYAMLAVAVMLVTIALYGVFVMTLSVPLPAGMLGE